eukprot:CAMPEP_0194126140 /NCGR_PEP_ID=MMETSP0150-20130528/59832_1 /TAXON_ID=122233 /ORGANISM="Chaetoceros debilis, Strain MM31A-1" /LENGTH=1500 /DNA_ID=CAMNT_0038819987 /DNA_START=214 /DNA_END=4713 /DNA_ORIENTATION=+
MDMSPAPNTGSKIAYDDDSISNDDIDEEYTYNANEISTSDQDQNQDQEHPSSVERHSCTYSSGSSSSRTVNIHHPANNHSLSKLLDDASEESNILKDRRKNNHHIHHHHHHHRNNNTNTNTNTNSTTMHTSKVTAGASAGTGASSGVTVGLRRSGRRRTMSLKYSEHLKAMRLLPPSPDNNVDNDAPNNNSPSNDNYCNSSTSYRDSMERADAGSVKVSLSGKRRHSTIDIDMYIDIDGSASRSVASPDDNGNETISNPQDPNENETFIHDTGNEDNNDGISKHGEDMNREGHSTPPPQKRIKKDNDNSTSTPPPTSGSNGNDSNGIVAFVRTSSINTHSTMSSLSDASGILASTGVGGNCNGNGTSTYYGSQNQKEENSQVQESSSQVEVHSSKYKSKGEKNNQNQNDKETVAATGAEAEAGVGSIQVAASTPGRSVLSSLCRGVHGVQMTSTNTTTNNTTNNNTSTPMSMSNMTMNDVSSLSHTTSDSVTVVKKQNQRQKQKQKQTITMATDSEHSNSSKETRNSDSTFSLSSQEKDKENNVNRGTGTGTGRMSIRTRASIGNMMASPLSLSLKEKESEKETEHKLSSNGNGNSNGTNTISPRTSPRRHASTIVHASASSVTSASVSSPLSTSTSMSAVTKSSKKAKAKAKSKAKAKAKTKPKTSTKAKPKTNGGKKKTKSKNKYAAVTPRRSARLSAIMVSNDNHMNKSGKDTDNNEKDTSDKVDLDSDKDKAMDKKVAVDVSNMNIEVSDAPRKEEKIQVEMKNGSDDQTIHDVNMKLIVEGEGEGEGEGERDVHAAIEDGQTKSAHATAMATITNEENTPANTLNMEDPSPMSPPPSASTTAVKKRRRRRSSVGRHIGGMVTLQDLEALEAFGKNAARARRMRKDKGTCKGEEKIQEQGEQQQEQNQERPQMSEGATVAAAVAAAKIKVADNSVSMGINNGDGKKDAAIGSGTETETEIITTIDIPASVTKKSSQKEISSSESTSTSDDNNQEIVDMDVPVDSVDDVGEQKRNEYENEVTIDLCAITAADIEAEIKMQFSEEMDDASILKKPCVSARLFASVILQMKAYNYNNNNNRDTEEMETQIPTSMMKLLQVLVRSEMASLQDPEFSNNQKRKKLHFCSFDYSSTITPVDIMDGSNHIIERCIEALYQVCSHVDSLTQKSMEDECEDEGDANHMKSSNSRWLKKIGSMLHALEDEEDHLTLNECSKSMPHYWPVERFIRASKQYRQEFKFIENTISSKRNACTSPIMSTTNPNSQSFVRKALGDFIGRAIRYHLRRLFNPVPVCLYTDVEGVEIPDYSHTRSRIHELLEMKEPDGNGQRDTATADGSISSVVGIALQRIVDFYSMNIELLARDGAVKGTKFIKSFCNRSSSKRGLQQRGCVIRLNENDIDEVLLDIDEGHTILAGIRACRFIAALINWPGVSEAIHEIGGWDTVESLASNFQECNLRNEMPEEYHFTLLENVQTMLKRIQHDADEMDAVEEICEGSFRKLW